MKNNAKYTGFLPERLLMLNVKRRIISKFYSRSGIEYKVIVYLEHNGMGFILKSDLCRFDLEQQINNMGLKCVVKY